MSEDDISNALSSSSSDVLLDFKTLVFPSQVLEFKVLPVSQWATWLGSFCVKLTGLSHQQGRNKPRRVGEVFYVHIWQVFCCFN